MGRRKKYKTKIKIYIRMEYQFQNKNVEYMRGKTEFINLNLENYDKN